jgi:hypothetical protein
MLKTVWIVILTIKRVMPKLHLRKGNWELVASTEPSIEYFIHPVGIIISSIGDDDWKN